MWRAWGLLLLVLAAPVGAHHTPEHVLSPPPVTGNTAPDNGDHARGLWLALGPFFALAALGALRWACRRRDHNRTR